MPATFYYEKNDVFEELAEGEDAVFESNTRLLVFAASVGYKRKKRVSDHDENGEIRWTYIASDQRLSVIAASLAYADTEDPEVILDPERQIEALTAFGAGGARLLEREVVDEPGSNLDNVIAFLKDHRNEEQLEQQVGVLEDIEKEISSLRGSSDGN